MGHRYILESTEPVLVEDTDEWALWYVTNNRHLACDQVGKDVVVSTIFLGMDYAMGLKSQPELFETRVMGGEMNGDHKRYATWDEALAGHIEMLEAIEPQSDQLAKSSPELK